MAISGAPFSDTKNGSWDSGRGHSHHRHPWADRVPSQPVFGSKMKTPQPRDFGWFWYRTKVCGILMTFVDIQVWHFFFAANLRLDAPHHWLLYHWLFQLSGSVLKLRGWWTSSTSKPLLFMRFYVYNSTPSTVSTHLNRTSRPHCPTSTLDVAFDWHSSYHSSPRIAVLLMLWRLDPKPLYNCLNRGQSQNTLTLELLAGLACIIFWWEKTRQRIEMDFDLQPSGILVQLSLAPGLAPCCLSCSPEALNLGEGKVHLPKQWHPYIPAVTSFKYLQVAYIKLYQFYSVLFNFAPVHCSTHQCSCTPRLKDSGSTPMPSKDRLKRPQMARWSASFISGSAIPGIPQKWSKKLEHNDI